MSLPRQQRPSPATATQSKASARLWPSVGIKSGAKTGRPADPSGCPPSRPCRLPERVTLPAGPAAGTAWVESSPVPADARRAVGPARDNHRTYRSSFGDIHRA